MKLPLPIVFALLGILLSPISQASQCSGGGPKPGWVDNPETITESHFFAAGVSEDSDAALSDRIATAKQNALKNLSEMIEVSVKNSLLLEQASRTSGGTELTDSSLLSITKTSTNASLRNVESIATWEDKDSCDLWLQVRVSKKHIEEGKREGLAKTLFKALNDHLKVIQDESLSPNNRMTAVDAALDVLPRIALKFIPKASSEKYYSSLLNRFKKALQKSLDDIEQAKTVLTESELLLNKAAGQNSEIEKSKTLSKATSQYKTLLAKHSNGLPPIFEPGDILFKLGEIEELRGSSCGARNYFQQAADSKQINDRHAIARSKVKSLACSDEDLKKTLWRQHFEGRPVTFICYFKTNTDSGSWNKACDGLNNIVRPLGAAITVRTKPLSSKQLKELKQGEVPDTLVEQDRLVLGIVAVGKMKNRIDRDSRSKDREYQFDGSMHTFLLENGTSVFSDRFQGKTGWNPVSEEMVMDVLAINVVKRWKGKFSKFLRRDLTQ